MNTQTTPDRKTTDIENWRSWVETAIKQELALKLKKRGEWNDATKAQIDAVSIVLLREPLETLEVPEGQSKMRTVFKINVPEDEGVFCEMLNALTNSTCHTLMRGYRGPCYGQTEAVFNARTLEDIATMCNHALSPENQLNKAKLAR